MKPVSDSVFTADAEPVLCAAEQVRLLKDSISGSLRFRTRLNAHPSQADPVHEMIICLGAATYIPPHRHKQKPESFHMIEGRVAIVLFSGSGEIADVIRLGTYESGGTFFYRNNEPLYHTVVVESELAVFHETTSGPFTPESTELAPWAPASEGPEAAAYLAGLRERIAGFCGGAA